MVTKASFPGQVKRVDFRDSAVHGNHLDKGFSIEVPVLVPST
jgi:hypothetical protein